MYLNVLELLAIKLALINFLHQREKNESHALSDRQQGSLAYHFKNGRSKKRTYDLIKGELHFSFFFYFALIGLE